MEIERKTTETVNILIESICSITIIGKCLLLRKNLNSWNFISITKTAVQWFIDCLLIWKVWISITYELVQTKRCNKHFQCTQLKFLFQQIPRNMYVMIVIPEKFSLCSLFAFASTNFLPLRDVHIAHTLYCCW